jgi:hypothetical protein
MTEKQKITSKCANPECNKPIIDTLNYCNEECLKRRIELKNQARKPAEANKDVPVPSSIIKPIEESALIDPNEGTKSKTFLKNKALRLIATYPDNLTLRQYASRLCWDISVSFRTALEGYIEPMVEKGILLHVRENLYRVNPKYRVE